MGSASQMLQGYGIFFFVYQFTLIVHLAAKLVMFCDSLYFRHFYFVIFLNILLVSCIRRFFWMFSFPIQSIDFYLFSLIVSKHFNFTTQTWPLLYTQWHVVFHSRYRFEQKLNLECQYKNSQHTSNAFTLVEGWRDRERERGKVRNREFHQWNRVDCWKKSIFSSIFSFFSIFSIFYPVIWF